MGISNERTDWDSVFGIITNEIGEIIDKVFRKGLEQLGN